MIQAELALASSSRTRSTPGSERSTRNLVDQFRPRDVDMRDL